MGKYIKNLKSRNRFIKEESFYNLGRLIHTLISTKKGNEHLQLYHS